MSDTLVMLLAFVALLIVAARLFLRGQRPPTGPARQKMRGHGEG